MKAFNLFYILLSIIWQPFQIYVLKVDGAGRTIMLLSILAVFLNLTSFWRYRKIVFTSAFKCWVLLILYSMLNVLYKGFYYEDGTFAFLRNNFLDSFVLLLIILLELNRDKYSCLKLIWAALGLYLLVGLPHFSTGLWAYRFEVEGIGNLYPLHAVCLLFVSAVLCVEDKMKRVSFVLLTIGVSVIILLSGTRKAFGVEAILLVGVILNKGKKRKFIEWLRLGVLAATLAVGVYFVLDNTYLGHRILQEPNEKQYVQLVENNTVNDILMMLLGDRAVQYEEAIRLSHDFFWTGIGLTNYMDVSKGTYRLHSEYMVQLCENGIIGFAMLMLFYTILLLALVRTWRKTAKKNAVSMALFGLVALLFLNLTCWTYNQNYVMVFYGILLMYACFDEKTDRMGTIAYENSDTSSQGQLQ